MTTDCDVRLGSSGFTSQQPFVVTADDLKLKWGGRGRQAFACGLCDHLLEEGDRARWIYAPRASNTFLCDACDGPDAGLRWEQRWKQTIVPILRRWGND